MKATRIKKIAILIIGIAIVGTACEPKPSHGGSNASRSKSEVEKMLDKLIDSLGKETDWSKSKLMYGRIESSIESEELGLRDKVKEDFHASTKNAYCHSMDNIMHIMMEGECGKHTTLDEIWKLRTGKNFSEIHSSLHEQVEQLHKTHEEMRSFINQVNGNRLGVTTFDVAYDEQYENNQKVKAKSYLNTNPTCTTIKSGLESIQNGTAFAGRRVAFCQKVVDCYLAKDSWNEGDENTVKSRIRFYTKDHRNDAIVKGWMEAIEEFRTTHQSN